MTYFAQLDGETVTRVIVATPEFIASGAVGDPATWIETTIDPGERKNYAAIGDTYDAQRDAFIAPKPFESWELYEPAALWQSPKGKPTKGEKLAWSEKQQDWTDIATAISDAAATADAIVK